MGKAHLFSKKELNFQSLLWIVIKILNIEEGPYVNQFVKYDPMLTGNNGRTVKLVF